MKKKKPLCMMLIVILIMQIILPTLTVVFESGITLKSIAEGTLETTVNGITWTYILKDGQATEVKPKDKTSLSGSVIIPSQLDGYTVTSIGFRAFYECSSLISIQIPEGVTSIGDGAFSACSSLTTIEVNEENTIYKSNNGVLYTKDGTQIICYPAKREGTEYKILDGVRSIGDYAFRGCGNLTSIEIPNGVTSISGGAFNGCSNLTSIEIPNGVKIIDIETFMYCSSLISIQIPDGVTSIRDSAFLGCSSLENIEIPEGVTSIGFRAFLGCSSLENIEIPEGVTSIGDSAFEDCSNLTSIKIPAGVTNIGDSAFEDCSNLTSIKIPAGVTSIGDSAFEDCSNLTSIEIPAGVTSIGDSAFSGCSSLTNIEIPEGVTSIGGSTFYGCSSLISIEIPEGVTSIGSWAFYNCSSLTNIVIPAEVGAYAFLGCTGLKSIVISEGVTEINCISIYNLSNLMSIEVAEKNIKYKSDEGVLYTKDGTKIILYPLKKEGTEYRILDEVTEIGEKAFRGCSSLENIEIPEGVTSIGYSAFNGCSNLTSIEIPNGVTSIENTTFLGCKNLESIVIPAGLTSIKSMAFSGCKNLESIAIPEGVISIENTAFSGCVNLKIYCKSDSFAESYAISKNIPYIIDDVSPIIISVMGISDEWKKDNVTLTVNAEDSISGLSTKAYSFDGGITWQESNSKTYTENTNNIIIKVKDKVNNITTYEKIDITKIIKLTGITVTNVPTKTTYIEGQNFDKTGMVVTAIYDNGLSEEITNYTIADGNNLTLGKTSVTISYTENGVTKTVVQVITVQAKTLTGITVTKAPTKTTYIEGQNFDKTGMVVTAAYNNGATQAVTNYTVADGNNLALGKTSVTISYTENGVTKTAVQGITVQAKTLTGITVTKAPIKTVYLEGQNFDKTGMVVTAIYDNGLSEEITNYTITDGNNLTLGKTSAIINYTENGVTKTVTQGITVTKKLEIKLDVYEEKQEGTTKYVGNIKPETTIENILKDIDTNGTVEIYKGTSKITDLNTKIGTGMTIKISLNNEKIEYTAVVTGDLNGDGLMGDIDVLRMARYKAGLDNSLNGAYLQASNIHKDNNYADDIDLLKMVRILVGLDTM